MGLQDSESLSTEHAMADRPIDVRLRALGLRPRSTTKGIARRQKSVYRWSSAKAIYEFESEASPDAAPSLRGTNTLLKLVADAVPGPDSGRVTCAVVMPKRRLASALLSTALIGDTLALATPRANAAPPETAPSCSKADLASARARATALCRKGDFAEAIAILSRWRTACGAALDPLPPTDEAPRQLPLQERARDRSIAS